MSQRARVLVADDHILVAQGLVKLLEPEFDVVGVAPDGNQLIEMAQTANPDVVMIDVSLPGLNGIAALKRLRALKPDLRALMVTMHADPAYVAAALQEGAYGYILKRSAASELVKAVRSVLSGQVYLGPGVQVEPRRDTGPQSLTARQIEVLRLVAKGCSAKEIATLLDISVKTVEFHKASVMDRLGLRTTAHLTRYALDHGLIDM
jgi:DNA-binding NarL/FixJ family response regulator